MPTTTSHRPWYTHVTIDLIAQVLSNSILHPFIACLLPVCIRAVGSPYNSPNFIYTSIYAALIVALTLLSILNQRIAYGPPREVVWDQEVVVITGGANGLGKILVEMYRMRGAGVAILDIRKPEAESDGGGDVKFYRCDISDPSAIEKAKSAIEKDLGTPTIVINNAGIAHGLPLLSLTPDQISSTFAINTLSHFHTIRAFLPGMLAASSGGTIVTVASVLGKLGASHLTDYAASKAALIAMHTSLRAELASPAAPEGAENLRMVLVTPGQLSTTLFRGVETPSSFFGPVVEPTELAREIVKVVDAGMSGEVSLPLYARWIEWMHVLPVGLQRVARWMAGVDRAMEGFKHGEPKGAEGAVKRE